MTPAIAPSSWNVSDYDVVILGCPVWAQAMASPMRSYIKRERNGIRRLALICTQMGAGGESVLRQMAGLARRPSIGDLVLREADVKSAGLDERLDRFAQRIASEAARMQTLRARTTMAVFP